jgi:hypothetical protein
MRDIAYEQALLRHQRRMLRILDEYSRENTDTWTERDFLAIQRALQVYIESFIGMARYFVQQKYNLPVGQSREALMDTLKRAFDHAIKTDWKNKQSTVLTPPYLMLRYGVALKARRIEGNALHPREFLKTSQAQIRCLITNYYSQP